MKVREMWNLIWPTKRQAETTVIVRIGRVLHWSAVAVAGAIAIIILWIWGNWTVSAVSHWAQSSAATPSAVGGSQNPNAAAGPCDTKASERAELECLMAEGARRAAAKAQQSHASATSVESRTQITPEDARAELERRDRLKELLTIEEQQALALWRARKRIAEGGRPEAEAQPAWMSAPAAMNEEEEFEFRSRLERERMGASAADTAPWERDRPVAEPPQRPQTDSASMLLGEERASNPYYKYVEEGTPKQPPAPEPPWLNLMLLPVALLIAVSGRAIRYIFASE